MPFAISQHFFFPPFRHAPSLESSKRQRSAWRAGQTANSNNDGDGDRQ
jgi:hypothetical protein